MIISLKCPQCGANLNTDDSKDVFFCIYCGHKIINVHQKVDVMHSGTIYYKQDRSNEPNLYISYNSSNPAVNMVTRIVATGQKNTYTNGTSNSFHLTPGNHKIVLKIGKKNYNREIFIRPDNAPVRISAGYTSKAFINIDQPTH